MPEVPFNTSLTFSIIGSEEKIEALTTALKGISLRLSLFEIYSSVTDFLSSVTKDEEVDFIMIDRDSFVELEEDARVITTPLIVVSISGTKLESLHNAVFDTIALPIDQHALEKTIAKFYTLKKHFEKELQKENTMNQAAGNVQKTFLIKRGKEFQLINTDNIPAFYTDNKLTFAYDDNGAKFLIQSTLIELESQLNTKSFFRANRQFLVNRKYINKIKQLDEGRFEIVIDVINSLRIDINQQKFSKLKDWIENN
jgi:two-component system response regulator LytT